MYSKAGEDYLPNIVPTKHEARGSVTGHSSSPGLAPGQAPHSLDVLLPARDHTVLVTDKVGHRLVGGLSTKAGPKLVLEPLQGARCPSGGEQEGVQKLDL